MELVIEDLSKSFGEKQVLQNISFTFSSGKIYGLLGRNGAGKTTFFNCLNGDIKRDSGKLYLLSSNQKRPIQPDDIGYVLSTPTVPAFLTGREFLKFFLDINEANISNLKTVDEYFEEIAINVADRDKLLKDYSHGMKNKMQMLVNMIVCPPVLLLDEPLTALDVVVAEEMKQLLRTLKQHSSKKGADYLNALFVKRHRKVLWRSSNQIALGFMALTVVLLLISYLCPSKIQLVLSKWSPSFLFFMMYLVNRGGSFTKALYMNCDYSLLNYNFFKKADLVFKLFIIRLRELIKINILPALSIGMGLGVIMYANGIGKVTDYILWILLAMCLSAFFSVHYLLMYYLLQPYTSGTDVKSGHYRILEIAPFFIFLRVIKIKISSIFLGVISIGMCVLYYFIAISLVRKYSTDTFRQRV